MAGPTEAHREFFKGMHGDPERTQAFMNDPRKAMEDAGLDSSLISDEHHEAITGGAGHTATTKAEIGTASAAGAAIGASIAAAF